MGNRRRINCFPILFLGFLFTFLSLNGLVSANSAAIQSDFNGDGFDDLAIGVPYENVFRGGVHVIYGSKTGLSAAGNQFWSKNSPGISGKAKLGDQFGYSLASGDFDNDGFDDLVIGVIGETVGNMFQAGAIKVIYGSRNGLTARDHQSWNQDSPTILDSAEPNDFFGFSLGTGDFDDDGFDDLAVGVWLEDLETARDTGAVNVFYGSPKGLSSNRNQFWHQDSDQIDDVSENEDQFGFSIASADFDNDGFDDLAVGSVGEAIGSISNAGAVTIIYGSPVGLFSKGNQFWNQNSVGIMEKSEVIDQFGAAIVAADFDNDRFDDLAIAVPQESVGGIQSAGAVHILYGSNSGIKPVGNQLWHQNRAGILESCGVGDVFGSSIVAGDFDSDSFQDLAIGIPFEDPNEITDAGAVQIIFGSSNGLSSLRNQLLTQDSAPGLDGSELSDSFGASLSVRDFDNNGFDDLAVGVPLEDIGSIPEAGAVNVFQSFPNSRILTGAQVWHQNSKNIKNACTPAEYFGLALDTTAPSNLIE